MNVRQGDSNKMSSRLEFRELRELLTATPHGDLVDAMVNYSSSDDLFMLYFLALAQMSTGVEREKVLDTAMSLIERVFGDERIPGSLDWRSRAKFGNAADLIEELLKHGMHEQVIIAAERCFECVSNLAAVHWPDDFLECYTPIIRSWILALHASGLSVSNISDQVRYLVDLDRYGAFYDLKARFRQELGEDVLAQLDKKKPT